MWLWAEKFKRRGLGWGFGRQQTGTPKGHNTGNKPTGSSNQTRKEGHEFGGNPTPHHQSYKESAIVSQYGVMALPKSAEGEVNVEDVEYQFQNDIERFTEDQKGKKNQGFNMEKLAPHEEKGESGFSVSAQSEKNGLDMAQGSFLMGSSNKNLEAPSGLVSNQANNKDLEYEKKN
jgi:hypothetical protein